MDKDTSSNGLLYLVSGVALVGAAAGAYLWSKGPSTGTAAPVAQVPTATLPPAGLPVYTTVKALGGLGTLGDGEAAGDPLPGRGQTFQGMPAAYFLELWTVRWNPAAGTWGQWDGPTSFRGHVTEQSSMFSKGQWSSPDDDLIAYLDALATTNQTLGFWVARSVPVLAEQDPTGGLFTDPDHTPTQLGTPGPWFSGRFGGLQDVNANANASVQAILSIFGGSSPNADVTVYEVVPTATVPMPIEVKLA